MFFGRLSKVGSAVIKQLDNILFTILLIFWFFLIEPITKQVSKMRLFKDMDDNQFWMTLWSMGFTGVMAIITTISIAGYNEDKVLHDLVIRGHDKIELSCLFNSGSSTIEVPCLLIAQEKAKTYARKNNAPE